MSESDPDELKQEVANAAIDSDEIDENDVIVGEPMTVAEFGEMLKDIQESRDTDN
jgi:hypothetical protein